MSSSAQWEVRFSNTRQLPYFYDSASGTSTWEAPPDLSDDAIKQLPGAAQYLSAEALAASASGASAGSATKVKASHLLIKHNKSRRPSSHRQVSFSATKCHT